MSSKKGYQVLKKICQFTWKKIYKVINITSDTASCTISTLWSASLEGWFPRMGRGLSCQERGEGQSCQVTTGMA